MKRMTLIIAAAALLISSSAFAQSVGEKTGVNFRARHRSEDG
jgi:hypothetical protein